MMSGPYVHTIPAPAMRQPLRLRLKPKGPISGYVDGSWWPQSRDLAAELPALVDALAVRLGSVRRVAYAMTAWGAAPRRTEVDGHTVRLEGFRSQDENVVHMIGPNRERLSLLVVPPEATDASGHDAMMTAAGQDNADSPTKILTVSGVLSAEQRIPAPRPAQDDVEDRLQVDGGRVHGRA
jgi:hypothetical protein